jgi:hypothetical protein
MSEMLPAGRRRTQALDQVFAAGTLLPGCGPGAGAARPELAANVSRQGVVLYLTAEDHPNKHLKPRLKNHAANMRNIHLARRRTLDVYVIRLAHGPTHVRWE